jgi:hypothetical protein
MKILIAILLALPLLSVAPIPAPVADRAPRAVWAQFTIVIRAPGAQPCTWETAPARLRQQIVDPIGYPFGMVEAWSCDGDSAAVIADLAQRAAEMQAQAAAYRAAHPIGGVR